MNLLEEMKKRGIRPTVITYTAAISACSNGGQWRKALLLLEAMKKHNTSPDLITLKTAIEACFRAGRYSNALRLVENTGAENLVEADRFSNPRISLLSTENMASCGNVQKKSTLDLHGRTLAVACMLVCKVLIDLGSCKSDGNSPEVAGLIIITGNGNHSDPSKGPVLQTGIRKFLDDNGGPKIANVVGNEGCFCLSKGALEKWLTSKDYVHFKKKIMV